MFSMSPAPFAEFLQFNFARDKLAVLPRPVIYAVAFTASDFYELFLRHCRALYWKMKLCANRLLFANLIPRTEFAIRIWCKSFHKRIYY